MAREHLPDAAFDTYKKLCPIFFPQGPMDYPNPPPRIFRSWTKTGKNNWHQGEIDKETGHRDGRGILIKPEDGSLSVTHYRAGRHHGMTLSIFKNGDKSIIEWINGK
jgi:hypothetical protein